MEIDIATAWATCNDGLRALRDKAKGASHNFKVRAVVGLWGNATDPEALTLLHDMNERSELRIADENRCFHPKVYIFRDKAKSVVWIGSANFTTGGFELNEELLLETSDAEHIELVNVWFDSLWNRCGPLRLGIIEKYIESRRANPPKPLSRRPASKPARSNNRLELLKDVSDWKSYTDALDHCHKLWWKESKYKHSVLGESCSWYHTISELHDVVVRKDWTNLDNYDKRRLLGLFEDEQGKWPLLGHMRESARAAVFEDNRQVIESAVRKVVKAKNDDFPGVAIEAYQYIKSCKKVGPGIATRLLALARPDRIVSLNSASQNGLAEFFSLAPTTLYYPKNYQRLLENLYESAWFNESTPKNSYRHALWSMRAALIDCFVYDPKAQ